MSEDTLEVVRKKKRGKKKDRKKSQQEKNAEQIEHEDTGRVPLKIETKCIRSDEILLEHIEKNSKRGLPEFYPIPNPHNAVIVLVGSGPSAMNEIESIREQKKRGRLIVALKGAHDFLIENGIKPDWCIMLDPQEKIVNCVKHHQPGITYFIASQCHPDVFDVLKEEYVIIWHALSMIGEDKILEGRVLIGGGTTTGLRAMNMIYSLGYRNAHLYGFDSCVTEKDGETYKRINVHTEGKLDKPGKIIDVWVGKTRYWANPAMAAQAQEFQQAMGVLKSMRVKVHGDGLIKALWDHHIGMGGNGWFEDE